MNQFHRLLSWLKNRPGKLKFPGRLVFIIIGMVSTLWFLIRVVPKPSRAGYPCMKAAFPFMSGLVIYLVTLSGSLLSFRKAKENFFRMKYKAAFICLVLALSFAFVFYIHDSAPAGATTQFGPFTPPDGANHPMGTPQGVIKGGVVWVWNKNATDINCTNTLGDAYFESFNTSQTVVDDMVSKAILNITGAADIKTAWDSLFIYLNVKKGRGRVTHADGEIIFIKINNGAAGWKSDGEYNEDVSSMPYITETAPQTVMSLLKQLIDVYGVRQQDIAIGDPVAHILKHNYDVWHGKYPNVIYCDRSPGNGRNVMTESSTAAITYSDKGTVMFGAVTEKLYTIMENAKYLINMAALKGHEVAGISLCAKNHFGSNTTGGASHLHSGLIDPNADGNLRANYREYRVQVDLMGSSKLGGNTVLFFVDGLWGGNAGGEGMPVKWVTAPFNNDWPSSLFVSQDQVALESVCYDFLRTEFTTVNHPGTSPYGSNRRFDYPNMPAVDDYLHQAADSTGHWPAGIKYEPDGSGHVIKSLGVHEHWNNTKDKAYSGNLGTGNGIKLITISNDPVNVETPTVENSTLNLFPNPVIKNATLKYTLGRPSNVKIEICNLKGQTVAVPENSVQNSGDQNFNLNISQFRLGTGVYFCRLTVSNMHENYTATARFQVIN